MAALDPQSMGATDPSADESQEQFVVCIAANGDGTYSVYPKDSDESEDDPNAPASESQPQTAKSIDEALQIAGQLLQEEQGEDSAEQGDGNEPMPADQAQSYWDQLAAKKDAGRM